MAQGTEASAFRCDLCQEFAKQLRLVLVEVSEVSIPILLELYQP
jgi:hypothetical protein